MDLQRGATNGITCSVTPDESADATGNPGVRVFPGSVRERTMKTGA